MNATGSGHDMIHLPSQHYGGLPPMMGHGYALHTPYPPPPSPSYQSYLHTASQITRKKSTRASQACDKCRERRSRCDEQRPCSTCKEQNIECHYKDSQPSKVDRGNTQITETLQSMFEQMKAITDRLGSMEERLGAARPTKSEDMSRETSRNDTHAPLIEQDLARARTLAEFRRPSLDVRYDFAEHTTAAHKLLLRWPSINKLLPTENRPENWPERSENYPLRVEDRGCLRLYERGEHSNHEDSVAISAASPAQSMNSDDLGAPSPEVLNNTFTNDEPERSDTALSARLEMDSTTLHRLFEKYKKHIHRLHPFLDIDQSGRYMRWFINNYSSDPSKYPHSPNNIFVANGTSDSQRQNLKRKRSEALESASFSSSDSGSKRRVQPDRTVMNAIVYLVFALGRVCEAVKVPGPLDDGTKSSSLTGPIYLGVSRMTVKLSPSPSLPDPTGDTPPTGDSLRAESLGSSYKDSPSWGKKYASNTDLIPGLEYYREAVSILGDFADANDLSSAQARLLAALYKGQLARVQESYSWLHSASRTCQYRIRLEGLDKRYDPQVGFDKTKSLTLLAYWTCLQLESDVLAELDYPHSGLSAMEGKVNWPNNVLDEEASRKIVSDTATDLDVINIYYSAQLFLRKHLNQIHTRLYGIDLARQDPKTLSNTLDDLDNTLQGWRNLPHPITFWNDLEPPHPDILAARLRAKYYGARYVTTRPFLDYALHVMDEVQRGNNLEDITKDARGDKRRQELVLFKAIQMMPEETIKSRVKICIDSAMKSTIALDGVNDHRLIVTNIMGTAHAQFGNILVLAAAANSPIPWIHELVPRDVLKELLKRTIKFLKRIQDLSKTACVDVGILKELGYNLDLIEKDAFH